MCGGGTQRGMFTLNKFVGFSIVEQGIRIVSLLSKIEKDQGTKLLENHRCVCSVLVP